MTTKAQQWARKTPVERMRTYRRTIALLHAVAEDLDETHPARSIGEIGPDGPPPGTKGEAVALRMAARSLGGVAARVQASIEVSKRPQCCRNARMGWKCVCPQT